VNFNKFKEEIVDEKMSEKSEVGLVGKISYRLEGYLELFRLTKPMAKISQNLLQSQEIKFGCDFGKLIENHTFNF
jgi:hypothetical protein